MSGRKPLRRLPDEFARLPDSQATTTVSHRTEISPFDILHHQEVTVSIALGINRPHNVGVIDRGNSLNLLLETGDVLGTLDQLPGHHFHGDHPTEHHVFGLEDRPHATSSKQVQQSVIAQLEVIPPGEQPLNLPAGQLAPSDQLATERFDLHDITNRIDFGVQRFEIISRQQVAAFETIEKLAEVNRGHGRVTATGESSGRGPVSRHPRPPPPARPPASVDFQGNALPAEAARRKTGPSTIGSICPANAEAFWDPSGYWPYFACPERVDLFRRL